MATGLASPVGGAVIAGTAPITFTSAAPQTAVDADLVVEWDFDNDGDFDQPEEDLDSYVMALETLAGRDFPSSLTGEAGPGLLKLTLLNDTGRFSYFNASSPLNAAPFSLRSGRRIRVRTADAVPVDPSLLARDRFRTDGPLIVAETGQAWTPRAASFFKRGGVAAADEVFGIRILHTLDAGQADHYVQATLRQLPPATVSRPRVVGLVIRFTDASNYTLVRYNMDETTPNIEILDRDAGVDTTLDTYDVRGWEGMTLGAGVVGTTVTAYVGGVPVATGTTGNATGNHCGLHAIYNDFTGRSPEIGDFHVWDKVPAEVDGILWTGTVLDVTPGVTVGDVTMAEVTAEGVLADAARAKIAAPRLPYQGARTGLVVGDVLSRAGLLHPPGPIKKGIVDTGPVGIEDGDALTLARSVEQVERGFLYETNEGHVGFDSAAARTGASSQAWFSDSLPAGQYGYSAIAPVDHKGQIINEVTAGVAAGSLTAVIANPTTQRGTDNVDITLPTVAPGDLLVIFISNSQFNVPWLVPIWWVSHRDIGDAQGMRVYSHFCDGTESGSVVTFTGAGAGLWTTQLYRVQNWYQSYNNGIAIGDHVPGFDPAALVHSWGRAPTMFIVCCAAISSSTGISFASTKDPPDGYRGLTGDIISSGSPFATDAGIISSYKVDCTESEDPTSLLGLSGGLLNESVVFAVRGYNGPHTKATLENPRTTGGDGRFVTRSDVDSQDEHRVIRSFEAPALFASEGDADAYCTAVLTEFAEDRPIFTLSFWASSSAELRQQAITRRVADKITVTATGDTALGVERDFFIESIGHKWTNAGKRWQVDWQLSPA